MTSKPSSVKCFHPVLGEWVIFAPVTDVRPWSGAVVAPTREKQPDHDPSCYLCPRVKRATGSNNPDYKDVFVFDNDFATLSMKTPEPSFIDEYGYDNPALGKCRVVCFSPRHNVTLAEMQPKDLENVLTALCGEFQALSAIPEIQYIMMFENKGKVIGVSNPHPHGQIYSTDFVPRIPATMHANASKHFHDKKSCLFCDILKKEKEEKSRIVTQNEHFTAFVPYFARFKYEVHIMPNRHVPFITSLTAEERTSLASIYHEMVVRFDNLFQMISPNITIFYNAPCKPEWDPAPWHFHIQFLPPLRSADKLKYLAGFESGGGNIINPSLPSLSAQELRAVSTVHF